MKKVFISMPMNGKSKKEIQQTQDDVLISVCNKLNEEIEHVENYLQDNEKLSRLECLAENLKRMATADYVVFVEGWENARGCKIERLCAENYGLEIIDVKLAKGEIDNG